MTATSNDRTHEPTVHELRRRSEENRAGLAATVETLTQKVSGTVDELKDRVNPANVKAEVKEYVQKTSENLIDAVKRKAIENPIQAVAIGAGLAMPLLTFARALPMPLMLIGAGLLLSRPAGRDAVGKAQNAAADAVKSLRDSAGEVADSASAKISEVRDALVRTGHDLKDEANDLLTKSGISAAADPSRAPGAHELHRPEAQTASGPSLTQQIENSPLLIAGIGLAIGAAVAAAFPSTVTEERLAAGAGEKLKETLEEVGSTALASVGNAKERVDDEVAQRGLSGEAVSNQADGLRQKTESVIRAGIDSFSDEKPTNVATPNNRP